MNKYIKLVKKIRWLLPNHKWQITFNLGTNKFGIRDCYFVGKIKGFDWSNYEAIAEPTIIVNRKQLEELRNQLNTLLDDNELKKRGELNDKIR